MRNFVGLGLLGAITALGLWLLHTGTYGWSLFIMIPILVGAIPAWISRPATAKAAARTGAISASVASFSLLFLGKEGLICIAMALPLTVPLGVLGSSLVYYLDRRTAANGTLSMLLILPAAGLTADLHAVPSVFPVHSSIEIAAPPEQVWKHVVSFSELPEPTEWSFRAGLAYPQRARITGSGPGAVRYCEFSTGPFVEPIETWDEPHLLRFRVTSNPAPMHEWSPYARVVPKHLHGYLVSKQGEFRLTELPDHRTRLEGTTWYQHGLWPEQYWRWWSDAIIHQIHMRVLTHIRELSERSETRETGHR